MTDKIRCSIIIPVLNEKKTLSKQLALLQPLREAGHEIIVVDGGSTDGSLDIAAPYADQLINSETGRAKQMNKGARCATHDWFLFLHVDTRLPRTALKSLQAAFEKPSTQWGHFDVCLSGKRIWFRIIAWFMNKRSRITSIATGDQAMFTSKMIFNQVGGFPDIALMEDISISRRLKKIAAPVCLSDVVITSSRRWRKQGIIRTILFMWALRLGYFIGVRPEVLANFYYRDTK